MKDIIDRYVNGRIEVFNKTEPKEDVADVVFIFHKEEFPNESPSILLIDNSEILLDDAIKEMFLKTLDDGSFFLKNNIEYDTFNIALFFTYHRINNVDQLYFYDYTKRTCTLIIFSLRGILLIEKEIQRNIKLINTPNPNQRRPYYLFFDTETTGLPKDWKAPVSKLNNWPRLVQLAYLLYDEKGNRLMAGEYIIKPDDYIIPQEASDIHRITTEQAIENGEDLRKVLSQFEGIIQKASVLVAHNISFDEKVLGAEYLRIGKENPLQNKDKICTMEATTIFCGIRGPYGYKWPKLSELYCKLFNEDFSEAHDAAVDIEATARCFWKLKEKRII